jgi:pimeloyl-ACP methyl ester carboxylesterase
LVLWGDRDIYFPTRFAEAYANVLPNAELEILSGIGHWPWIDDAQVIDRILSFAEQGG